VVYLVTQTRSGMSAKTLERMTGTTYKCAWRMLHQIRKLMAEDGIPLMGQIEVDETYIHADPSKNTRLAAKTIPGKRYYDSQIVLGAVERGGRAKVWHVKSSGARVLLPKIISNVVTDATIFSDDWRAYIRLPLFSYQHATINHSEGKYVNGHIHTQNVENLWSHIKLGIKGVYRHVSPKHLQAYIDEYSFRYSHIRTPKFMFDILLANVAR
jgi:transposase